MSFSLALIALTALCGALVDAKRTVYNGGNGKSAWMASYKRPLNDTGDQDVVVFSMGTKGTWGNNLPPFVFTAYAKGQVEEKTLDDPNNLLAKMGRKVDVDEAAAMLYVHWGVGEWCDIDDKPGFGGSWPPQFGKLVETWLKVALSTDAFTEDTFLTAADWRAAKFQNIEIGEDGEGRKTATVSTEPKDGKSVYAMTCHSAKAGEKVQGLQLGEFRYKCDFQINFDGLWVDQHANANKSNVLLGGKSIDENLAENKGCPKERRKIALLAFLAGAKVSEEVADEQGASAWKTVTAGDAEFAFVDKVSILDRDGKDTGVERAVNAQIEPLADLLPMANLPPFLATTRAVLFTFEASRADLLDGRQIFFDPTFGFASDPSDGDNSSGAAALSASLAALLAGALASASLLL